jgi:hypothetical protein
MFKQDEVIVVRARVIRQRGTTVEAQLPDGNLLRIDASHVAPADDAGETHAPKKATHKAVKMGD